MTIEKFWYYIVAMKDIDTRPSINCEIEMSHHISSLDDINSICERILKKIQEQSPTTSVKSVMVTSFQFLRKETVNDPRVSKFNIIEDKNEEI